MENVPQILPAEGLHVVHLFYRIEYGQWALYRDDEQRAALTRMTELVQEIRATPKTQLLTLSMVTPKADLGFMLITADLNDVDAFSNRLSLALGADVLNPVFTWLSMTERSEYTATEEEYGVSIQKEDGLEPGSPEYDEKIVAFRERMEKYLRDRLEPNMADWPVFCFYPMSKRRVPGQNWYALDFDARKKLMAGHARVGRTYAGRVRQLITGAAGLDDGEWGVTLLAQTTSEIKSIVYEMRFDEVSAHYADFGEFYIGIQLPLDALFRRLEL